MSHKQTKDSLLRYLQKDTFLKNIDTAGSLNNRSVNSGGSTLVYFVAVLATLTFLLK